MTKTIHAIYDYGILRPLEPIEEIMENVIRLFKNDSVIIKMFAAVTTACLPIPVVAVILFAARTSSRQKENTRSKIWRNLSKSMEKTHLFHKVYQKCWTIKLNIMKQR